MQAQHLDAVNAIIENSRIAIERLNEFSSKTFRTRGGRIGSGMGSVIEALWGFSLNQLLEQKRHHIELAWMYGHGYNDFACIQRDAEWNPETGEGELLRVEVKSMVASADESKAHFDRLKHELHETDLLVVFLWDWIAVGDSGRRVSPQIKDYFIGRALDVAMLRDALHEMRGGTFVKAGRCPDKCEEQPCVHVGEPLNASGKRERLTGPKKKRVSQSVSYAANFGGLVRMLKCSSSEARKTFRKICKRNDTAWEFASFIHCNLPAEEESLYSKADWVRVGKILKLKNLPQDKSELIRQIRAEGTGYRKILRSEL